MPSVAMVMMMLVASFLGAVPAVEGYAYYIYDDDDDYSSFYCCSYIQIAGFVVGGILFCCACYFGYFQYKKRKNNPADPPPYGMAQQPDPRAGQGRGAFSDGLFDCGSDLGSACNAWCCPCLSASHITNVAPELGTFDEWWKLCCLGALCCVGYGGAKCGCMLAEFNYRQRARQLYGIPEGDCPDAIAVCCCQCCALSQLHRHVDRYPPRNLERVVVAPPHHTAAYAETPASRFDNGADLSYALTNDEYLSVAAGHGGGNKGINIDVGHADSSGGKVKESSFSGFDNGSSDDEIEI